MDPRITLSVKSYLNFCWAILKLRILVQLSEWRDVPFFLQGRAILWCPWMMVLILFQCEKINKTYQPPLSPPKKKQRAFRKQITQRAYAKLTFQKWGPAWMLVLLQHQQGSWYLCSTNSYLKLRDYMDEKGATWMLVLFQHQQCSWYLSAPTNTMFTCSAMFFCGCWTYIDRTIPIHIHVQQQQCSTSGLPGWWYMFTALLKILNRENWFRIHFSLHFSKWRSIQMPFDSLGGDKR